MLQINRIDIKTGQFLYEIIEGVQQTKQKRVENSYLEYWLKKHGIEAQFYVGKFYKSINDADRLRLEAEGKFLIFSNGKDGYLTDAATAQLLTEGAPDRGINPIYASDRKSPHNLVAYGSLVASDGIASTSVQNVRVLVIDDEHRDYGTTPLLDGHGNPLSPERISALLDKMGDGTMLVPQALMRRLITDTEREEIAARVYAKAGISTYITTLAQEEPLLQQAQQEIERQVDALARRTVTQFRAASIDADGIYKGTMGSSRICDELDAIIVSSNCYKGGNQQFAAPGIRTVSDFWLNRKSDGRYGEQSVGPQVQGCIPEATLHEFNPRKVEQAQALAAVAANPIQLAQYYIEQKERQRNRADDWSEESLEEGAGGEQENNKSDWLYNTLKADQYGQLTNFSKVKRELDRYLKGEWLDYAMKGVYVPSAMAQHHSQLKPWEVCNKDLPHGAIIAYYRSPFPNVGAAAIAINNTEILKQKDAEAFAKDGVAYLPPWTAKNVAITDFDRDANGYFVGYTATVTDLPQQIRAQLAPIEQLLPAEQYEAGRALFDQLIQQLQQGQEDRIVAADYPLAVFEFTERNAPDRKPPEVVKQKKENHPWHEGESHAAATWRAWSVTADNPTGKVANVGMMLQSLALEMTYAPVEQREELLRQISAHYGKQLQKAQDDKLFIPGDDWLKERGFPALHFQERMQRVADARSQLAKVQDPDQRQALVGSYLKIASQLLEDIVNGPNALNLQTAVDSAKSARGIEEFIHSFAKALAHKEHHLRAHYKDFDNYVAGKLLATNTQEPIGWGVEAVNRLYFDAQLPERDNASFRDLIPKDCTPRQETHALTIARTYNDLVKHAFAVKDILREKRVEAQQPTMLVTSARGRDLVIQRLQDKDGVLPIWRASEKQVDWSFEVQRDSNARSAATEYPVTLNYTDGQSGRQSELIGYLSPQSVEDHHLTERLEHRSDHTLLIESPTVKICPPLAQQNDFIATFARAGEYAREALSQIPAEERQAYLSALWHDSGGMGFALKFFQEELGDRLTHIPEIRLTGITRPTNEAGLIPPGEYIARFSQYSYLHEASGEMRTSDSIALVDEAGNERQFGSISPRSTHLPLGTTVRAHIEIDETAGNFARMNVLGLVTELERTVALIETPESEPPALQVLPGGLLEQAEIVANPSPAPSMVAEQPGRYDIQPVEPLSTGDRLPLTIITDGACSGNPGPGGWGAILQQGNVYVEIGGSASDTTNNRMEILAGIEALKFAKAKGMLHDSALVTIIADSQLFINGATGVWQRNKNQDLWVEYDQAASGINLQFQWVRGHSGHSLNERVDAIAKAFSKGDEPKLVQRGEKGRSPSIEFATPAAPSLPLVHPVGKPVQMSFNLQLFGEPNPLPVGNCFDALRYGRCHTTRTFEPYSAYGFQQGNAAITYRDKEQIAFIVGRQYPITAEMIADPTYLSRWAAMEKHSAKFLQTLHAEGKPLWGLEMQPLGDYDKGIVTPFPDRSLHLFSPNKQTLYDWIDAAGKVGDDAALKQVYTLGRRMMALYGHETGQAGEKPPLDYTHPLVVVSQGDRQRLMDMVEASKLSTPVVQVSQRKQVEVG